MADASLTLETREQAGESNEKPIRHWNWEIGGEISRYRRRTAVIRVGRARHAAGKRAIGEAGLDSQVT